MEIYKNLAFITIYLYFLRQVNYTQTLALYLLAYFNWYSWTRGKRHCISGRSASLGSRIRVFRVCIHGTLLQVSCGA